MSKKDKALENEKRIKEHLLTLSKEQIIELYLQIKFERDYLESQYMPMYDECKVETKMFKEEKTNRGFDILWFDDDYGEKCSLQEKLISRTSHLVRSS